MALEVREDEQGVVFGEILSHDILFDDFSVRDGPLDVGTFRVHQVHGEAPGPAVFVQDLLMFFRRVPLAVIGGIAFYNGAVHMFDHGTHEFGMEEILVSVLAGVDLDGNLSGKGKYRARDTSSPRPRV